MVAVIYWFGWVLFLVTIWAMESKISKLEKENKELHKAVEKGTNFDWDRQHLMEIREGMGGVKEPVESIYDDEFEDRF